MKDTYDIHETDALQEGVEMRGLSEDRLSGAVKDVMSIIKPSATHAKHQENPADAHDTSRDRVAQVKAELATVTETDDENLDVAEAVHTAREQKEERHRAHQESANALTLLANGDAEENYSDRILTQPVANDDEKPKTKETKSYLAKIATKLKDGVKNYYIPDHEKLTDREYTQEELFDLVKRAEAELLKEKMEEQKKKGLVPAVIEEAGTIDINALAATATELTKQIKENETSFSELIAREKKGETLSKLDKAQLLYLWKTRGTLINSLSDIEWKRYAYTSQLADQTTAALVHKLFTPVRTLIWKVWDKLNQTNPMHEALPKLHSAVYAKIRKENGSDWGIKQEFLYRQWSKHASPSEMAYVISEKQIKSKQTDFALAAGED